MKTQCIIVDDEPLAIKLLRSHVEKIEDIELVAECKNAMQAYDVLRKQKVDLMLLDIQMPQITGIDFLKSLSHPPKVIFTTAYRNYALEGFDLEVVDYLLKPIQFERFFKAISRYFALTDNNVEVVSPESGIGAKEGDSFIYVKENKKVFKIFLNQICFIEGLGEYVKIHTQDQSHVTKTSLTSLEGKLPPSQFVRTHKSYIVGLSKISAFTTSSVDVNNQEIPVGRTYKQQVFKLLGYDNDSL
jgi:DNA-binding LytR/AlgR family response regulator